MDNRGVSLEKRSALPDELGQFVEMNNIPAEFDSFVNSLRCRDDFGEYMSSVTKDGLHIFNFDSTCSPPVIMSSVVVTKNFNVTAFQQNTAVQCGDLLGFQYRLQKWSQLHAILNRTKNQDLDVNSEIGKTVNRLRETVFNSAHSLEKFEFLFEQLELLCTKPIGRRYSAQTTMRSLQLFLCNRSCCKKLRMYLALPHPNTLKLSMGSFENRANRLQCDKWCAEKMSCFTGRSLHKAVIDV